MNKLKTFYKEHKEKVWFAGGVILTSMVGAVINIVSRNNQVEEESLIIDLEWYNNLDDAVEAFKNLEKDVKYPIICGHGECYGVGDETPAIREEWCKVKES